MGSGGERWEGRRLREERERKRGMRETRKMRGREREWELEKEGASER